MMQPGIKITKPHKSITTDFKKLKVLQNDVKIINDSHISRYIACANLRELIKLEDQHNEFKEALGQIKYLANLNE